MTASDYDSKGGNCLVLLDDVRRFDTYASNTNIAQGWLDSLHEVPSIWPLSLCSLLAD